MKYITLLLLMIAATASVSAQVFEPVPSAPDGQQRPVEITAQAAYFNWAKTKLDGLAFEEISPVGEIEAPLSNNFLAGGWVATDRQKVDVGHLDSTWANFHVSYLPVAKGATTLGLTLGELSAHLESNGSTDNGTWTEIGLVGSIPLAKTGIGDNIPELGLSFAEEQHQNHNEGNGATYGASLKLPIAKRFSVDVSVWQFAIHNASTITIAAVGLGWRL